MNRFAVDIIGLLNGLSLEQSSDCQVTRKSGMVFVLSFIIVQALAGCSGANGQREMPVTSPVTNPATNPAVAAAPSESGDAWQGRYVGTVTIGDVQYFGDALLTADGLIRLYIGGPGGDDGVIQETIPAGSAQLVGTLQGQTNQITGAGVVFGQECAVAEPIRFCAEAGQAALSMTIASAKSSPYIQGEILVTTSVGTETWTLNLGAWSNDYALPTTQGDLKGNYQEVLAEFSFNGDTVISLAADGSLSFQSPSSGCTGTGQWGSHLDGAVSVYDVSLSILGCQAPYDYLNGAYSGLASESPSDYWNYDTVLRMWLSQDANVSGSSRPALTLLGVPQ